MADLRDTNGRIAGAGLDQPVLEKPAIAIIGDNDDRESKPANPGDRIPTASVTHGELVDGSEHEEQHSVDDQAGDDDSDSDEDEDSFLGDVIESYSHSGNLSGDLSVCSDEEAAEFRSQLRTLGLENFVEKYLSSGQETAKRLVHAFGLAPLSFLNDAPDESYYEILGRLLMRELSRRLKLPEYNSFEDAVSLIQKSKKIVVITGAGISTNLGIPDFRSKNTGFYAQMKDEGFEDPQVIFDLEMFDEDPSIFYRYAYLTLPDGRDTTPTHAFIKLLQDRNQLLTNYTQNIDNIEGNAGLRDDKIIQCHGSWASFTCRKCSFKGTGDYYYDKVRKKQAPDCPSCVDSLSGSTLRPQPKRRKTSSNRGTPRFDSDEDDDLDDNIPQPGKMKPDITFFHEKLPDRFFDRFKNHDIDKLDLIVVIGTSMQVAPVSEIPLAVDKSIPQIFISKEITTKHCEFDVVLLGDCDMITSEIAKRAGWELQHPMLQPDRRVEVSCEDEKRGVWRFRSIDADKAAEEQWASRD